MLSIGRVPASFGTLEDAVSANRRLGNKYVVVLSLSRYKSYGLLLGHRRVLDVPMEMCLLEMVLGDTARPFIDFDGDVINSMEHIESIIGGYYLREHRVHVTISWKWSGYSDTRWHCVISGVYYENCWHIECLRMVDHLVDHLPDLNVDRSIYKEYSSSLRMVGQCKYDNGMYTRRLLPLREYDIEDLCVSRIDSDICLCRRDRAVPRVMAQRGSMDTLPSVHGLRIPPGLVLGDIMYVNQDNIVYRLNRAYPSYCEICRRIHDKENSMLILRMSSFDVICFRDATRSRLTYDI